MKVVTIVITARGHTIFPHAHYITSPIPLRSSPYPLRLLLRWYKLQYQPQNPKLKTKAQLPNTTTMSSWYLEFEIYESGRRHVLSTHEAADMASRVVSGRSASPQIPHTRMLDLFDDTLPIVRDRGNGYTRPQPRPEGYYEHPRGYNRQEVHSGDASRSEYLLREVRPFGSFRTTYEIPCRYVYEECASSGCLGSEVRSRNHFDNRDSFLRSTRSTTDTDQLHSILETVPGGLGYAVPCNLCPGITQAQTFGGERSHERDSERTEYSTPRPFPRHSTTDTSRRYIFRETVSGRLDRFLPRELHAEYPPFPAPVEHAYFDRCTERFDYFKRVPGPSSNYKGDSGFCNSFYQDLPDPGCRSYNTRIAVPGSVLNHLPHSSPHCDFQLPPHQTPQPFSHGYSTRNATPNVPRPPSVSKAPTVDLYAILGVLRTATGDELKKAHRKLSLQYHPDRVQGNKENTTAMMAKINQAYDVLKDEMHREQYDKTGQF
jgi:hypothetical protein